MARRYDGYEAGFEVSDCRFRCLGTVASLLDYGGKVGDNQASARTAAKRGREGGRFVINSFKAIRELQTNTRDPAG